MDKRNLWKKFLLALETKRTTDKLCKVRINLLKKKTLLLTILLCVSIIICVSKIILTEKEGKGEFAIGEELHSRTRENELGIGEGETRSFIFTNK